MDARAGGRNLRSIALNAASSYLLYGFSALYGIVVVPIVLNGLGRDAYGLMGSANSLWQYLTLLSLGTNTSIVRYIPQLVVRQDQEAVTQTASTFMAFNIVVAFVGLCLIVIISASAGRIFDIPESLKGVSALVMLSLGLSSVLNLFGSYLASTLIGLKRLYVHSFLQIGSAVVAATTSIGLIFAGYGIVAVCLGTLAVWFFFLLIRFMYVHSLCPGISLRMFDRGLLKKLIVPSLFYFLLGVGSTSVYQSGNILIGSFLGVGAVAIYAATRRLLDTGMGLLLQFSDVLVPYVAEAEVLDGTAGTRFYHRRLLKVTLLLTTIVCFLLVAYGKVLISAWLGIGNYIGDEIWIILCVWMFVHAITQPGSITIIAVGKHRSLVLIVVVEAIVSIALGILLVHGMGVFGIVLASLVGAISTSGWFVHWFTARITGDSLPSLIRYAFIPGLAAVLPAALWQLVWVTTGMSRGTLAGLVTNGIGSSILLLTGVCFLGFNSQERQKVVYFFKSLALQLKR
jgi:O-antigen/teichoic acid export membrane protein